MGASWLKDKLMGYRKPLLLKNTIAAPSPGAVKLPFGSDLETEAAVLSLARTFFPTTRSNSFIRRFINPTLTRGDSVGG